ncbi:hypothetical protein QZH41_019212, partial [Actinostola sp. cb2023]
MATCSVKVDLGHSKYCKSYDDEFKTDWLHQRPNSGFFHSLKLNDDEFEEDMKDEIDSVMGLLDRMKEDRQHELMSSEVKHLESRSRVRQARPVEVKVQLGRDQNGVLSTHDTHREGQQKRKQDTVVAEIREKAEIISKSARKGPEDVASTLSRTQNIEDDPETAQYLKKIRDTSTTEEPREKKEQPVERSAITVDFPSQSSLHKTSVTVKLNLDMQKSKIAIARGSGLKGRRKPTTEHIRRSLRLSDDEEPEDALAKFDASLEEEMDADDEYEPVTPVEVTSVEASVSEAEMMFPPERAETKTMPQSPVEYGQKITLERRGSFEGLIPRSTPKDRKPAWKSKTYGGVALPAFAEAMKAGSKSLKKTDTAEKLLTADIVKQAALDKLNRAAKEDKLEKEPEKPAWLAEAEARRKVHDRRRQNDNVKIKPIESESRTIPIRLKRTGSKLLEDEADKNETTEVEDNESKTNKIVFKLKRTGGRGEMQAFEPEPAKISFKLKPTGIQLVKPAEESRNDIDTNEPLVIATLVKDFETQPGADVHLRHVSPVPRKVKSTQESELAIRLRRRGKAPPIYPDDDEEEPSLEPRTSKPAEEPKVKVSQTPTTYDTPRPIKVVAASEYRAVSVDRKPLETAKLVNQQPMRTSAESTPPLSQTRSATKPFYKVTPIPSEPIRSTRGYSPLSSSTSRISELPMSPSSSRTFSPPMSPSSSRTFSPPMSPTSKVTVVAHHVEPTPSSGRSVLPAKSVSRGRRLSAERSKTVAIKGSEVPRIIPGRRSSPFDDERNPVRRTTSLEYPKSHVERATDGHLKHAVTVVKASNIPQKARTMMATDFTYRPPPSGEVLPVWKQELMETRRKTSISRSEQDVSVRSWSSSSLSNKENEPRIVTQMEPMWMRELADKKRNVYNLSSDNEDVQLDRMEALERFEKPVKIVDSDDE